MEPRYLIYTKKEVDRMIKYYIGTPKIYKYCYDNSEEFKNFIDSMDDRRKKAIKLMHISYYGVRHSEPLVHLSTFGLSYIGKKAFEHKELKKVDEVIKSDRFKTLFKNFDEVLKNNGLEW